MGVANTDGLAIPRKIEWFNAQHMRYRMCNLFYVKSNRHAIAVISTLCFFKSLRRRFLSLLLSFSSVGGVTQPAITYALSDAEVQGFACVFYSPKGRSSSRCGIILSFLYGIFMPKYSATEKSCTCGICGDLRGQYSIRGRDTRKSVMNKCAHSAHLEHISFTEACRA